MKQPKIGTDLFSSLLNEPLSGADELEVESATVDLNHYLNRAVEITGEFASRWGPERGEYSVLVVSAIKEV